MKRRSLFAAIAAVLSAPAPFLARTGASAAGPPDVAEVEYGPVHLTSPRGERFWCVLTDAGPVNLREYDELFRLPPSAFVAAIRQAGEWCLIGGWPNHWSSSQRWEQLL